MTSDTATQLRAFARDLACTQPEVARESRRLIPEQKACLQQLKVR